MSPPHGECPHIEVRELQRTFAVGIAIIGCTGVVVFIITVRDAVVISASATTWLLLLGWWIFHGRIGANFFASQSKSTYLHYVTNLTFLRRRRDFRTLPIGNF